jgi:hypothetical protein
MGIVKRVRPLAYQRFRYGGAIKSTDFKEVMARLNVAYEALWDESAPGAVAQDIFAHSHCRANEGDGGGGPMCRGSLFGVDGGISPFLTWQPTKAKDQDYRNPWCYPTSEGLDTQNGWLVGDLLYAAKDSNFTLTFSERGVEGSPPRQTSVVVELPQTYAQSEDVVKRWVRLQLPVAAGRRQSFMTMLSENDGYDANNTPQLELYSLHWMELDGQSTTRQGQAIHELTGGAPIKAFFTPLNDALVNSDDSLDAETQFRLKGFLNGLFEGVLDTKAPGATSQSIKGHDHTPTSFSGYYGGRALHRGVVYVAYNEEGALFLATPTNTTGWFALDLDFPVPANKYGRTINSEAMFEPYCSPGWDSPGAGIPSGVPYLSAWVRVGYAGTAGPTFDLRFNQTTLSRQSNVVSTTLPGTSPFYEWLFVEKIPVASGFNKLDLEVRSSIANEQLEVNFLCLFEHPDNAPTGNGTYAGG